MWKHNDPVERTGRHHAFSDVIQYFLYNAEKRLFACNFRMYLSQKCEGKWSNMKPHFDVNVKPVTHK